MFAITLIIRNQDGKIETHRGSLIDIPSELTDWSRLDKYRTLNTAGWNVDEFGLAMYSKYDYEGRLIIVPGIWLPGTKRPKRFSDMKFTFSKAQIEKFVEQIIAFEKQSFERASQDVNMLVHDLRNISSSIYNAALEAENYLYQGKYVEADVRIKNIKATQAILKIRTDVLDFIGNPASIIRTTAIEVYRKVDKVCRSLKPDAQTKGKAIHFSGYSNHMVDGPDIFEILPFVLIENAVKYSPVGCKIDVTVNDNADSVELSVSSLGPEIKPHERESIFEKGVRGHAASANAVPGTGFGLFLLKSITKDHFLGEASVSQDLTAVYVNGQAYFNTVFTVVVPIGATKNSLSLGRR